MSTTWKKLLIQAFKETRIPTNLKGHSGFLNIQKYIYLSLQNAGIENRSPFTYRQLISIRQASSGIPEKVRDLCIQTVQAMQNPASGFSSTNIVGEITVILMSLSLLLIPQTATTSRAAINGSSILVIKSLPVEDIDKTVMHLPLSSDYLSAASLYVDISPIQETVSGLFGSQWIKNQKDSSYSLQLLSASNSNNLLQFCRQHNICEKSAQYETDVNGKRLTRLLYGVYPDHKAAKLAKSQLPASLKKIVPWARQFKQIKREL